LIRLRLSLETDGCLSALRAEGHARQGKAGSDLVCAAFTALVKALFNLLSTADGIQLEARAEREGIACLRVLSCTPERRSWLKGVTDFFLRGMADLKQDYPETITIEVNNTCK